MIFLFSVQNWFLKMIFASKFVKLTEQILFLKVEITACHFDLQNGLPVTSRWQCNKNVKSLMI